MENFNNSPLLDNLSAGRDFADYLIDNGWNIINLFVNKDYTNQSATFQKDNVKIDYIITEKESSFYSKINVTQLKGWHDQIRVSGPDLEGNVTKFAFLCHSLGWVDMNTAVKGYRNEFEVKKAA